MPAPSTPANATTADRVYAAIRESINSAELKPGVRLVHRQLAEQFGTSNIPVLEALRRLESDGLVVSYPNMGAQVRIWTEHDIKGAFLARKALEGVTARLFVEQASAVEKAQLVEYGRKFDEACVTEQFQRGRKLDFQLHLHIAKSGHGGGSSSVLFKLVENSCLLSSTILSAYSANNPTWDYSGPVGIHDEMITALLSGNADLAEQAAEAHVQFAMDDTIQLWANNALNDI